MSQELSCREVVELLSDYLEGALDPTARAHVETHVAGCEGCTMVLDQLRETIRLSGEVRETALSPDQRETLVTAFRRHHADDA